MACQTLLLRIIDKNWQEERKMSNEMATPTVQIENNHLRVTEWRFAPGAATGYHRHEHDYVVVPARDGELKLIGPQGEISFAQLHVGKSYFRNAGVEHNVINNSAAEMVFVEIELKDTAIGKTL
jgi:beta-alanine degradation protein BauB